MQCLPGDDGAPCRGSFGVLPDCNARCWLVPAKLCQVNNLPLALHGARLKSIMRTKSLLLSHQIAYFIWLRWLVLLLFCYTQIVLKQDIFAKKSPKRKNGNGLHKAMIDFLEKHKLSTIIEWRENGFNDKFHFILIVYYLHFMWPIAFSWYMLLIWFWIWMPMYFIAMQVNGK